MRHVWCGVHLSMLIHSHGLFSMGILNINCSTLFPSPENKRIRVSRMINTLRLIVVQMTYVCVIREEL
jgi:hypothetical protein